MNFPRHTKNTVLLILTVTALILLLSAAISVWLSEVTTLNIPNIGTIKTIGVEAYWDQNLENKTEVVDWDIIWSGASKNVILYMRSISNVHTVMQFNVTNWNPKNISKYMNLSWNYNGKPIYSGEVVQVTITLSTSPSVRFMEYIIAHNVKEFSFDIVIYAIE